MIHRSASGRTGEGGVLTAHGDASGLTLRRSRDRGRRGRPQRRRAARRRGPARGPVREAVDPRRSRPRRQRRGVHAQPRRAPHRGQRVRAHQGLRARRQDARPRRGVAGDAGVGQRQADLGLDPRPLLRRQGRAQEGDQGAARHQLGRARGMGRPSAADVDRPAHQRPGRRRPVRVPRRARVPDRRVVRPLGERQPLGAQDALRGEAHGRLLVLARPGLGRHVARPRRCHHRARRRGAPRARCRAGRHRAGAR